MFSSPKIVTEGAEDSGQIDEWMMSNLPAEVLIPLAGLAVIAESDNRNDLKGFISLVLRGVKGINGFTVKQGENIAINLNSQGTKKIVRRPNLLARNTYDKNWREKAEEEGAEVIE